MLDVLLACPRCDNALTVTDQGHACNGCKVEFPNIGDIPFLFSEPVAALGEWKSRLHMELQRLEHEARSFDAALANTDLRPATQQRLTLLLHATRDQRTRLAELLEPLELTELTASLDTYLALRTRLPSDQGLHTYYPNIHRDWCWGERENEASIELVADMLDEPLGRTLVLGAGAGRLAYDLHRRAAPLLTVALDFNPMFMLLAQRLARGDTIELYEFPLAPISAEDQARLRTLKAPEPVDANFCCVIADASRPPFRKGAFDTIITPWLTDILPSDLSDQAARINYLLRADGQWINFGSVAFDHADPAQRYGLDEVVEIISEQGFDMPRSEETRIPYMCSPASRHGRQEYVVTLGSTKTGKTRKGPRYKALPEWLVKGDTPVPLLDSIRTQALTTRIHSFVMSLVDGRRSIEDMANLMDEQKLMPRNEARTTIRSFMIKVFEDSRK